MMEPLDEMKLTHLGIDCLEPIFRYLPLEDLMNVADSNKQLKTAADLVFRLKYGSKTVVIDCNKCKFCKYLPHPYLFTGNWSKIGHCIEFIKLNRAYQMFRCFGHLTSKLEITSQENRIHFDHLMFCIKEYCIESLTELAILKTPDESLNHFVKPFSNIHTLCVRSSDLTNISLSKLFPKMKRLTYHCKEAIDFASIESDVPNLEHLEIIERGSETGSLRKIRLYQKLQSLAVPSHAIYQGINEILTHLQILRLNETPIHFDNSTKFHFKTVKRFEVIFYSWHFSGLPYSFDKLEEFILKFASGGSLRYHHEKFYDFILEHPSIIKLEIGVGNQEVNLSKLMNMLPLVREFYVRSEFSIHDVIRFMNEKKTLKDIKIYLRNGNNYDISDILVHLNDRWHGVRPCFSLGPFKFDGPFKLTRI